MSVRLGTSPGLAATFPELPVVTQTPGAYYDLTVVLSSEYSEWWAKNARRVHPFVVRSPEDAERIVRKYVKLSRRPGTLHRAPWTIPELEGSSPSKS